MYENDRELGRSFGSDLAREVPAGSRAMVAFGIGMVAGAVTALLLTPQTGSQMRGQLKRVSSKFGEKAKEGYEQARHVMNKQKDKFGNAVEEGRKTYQRESASGTTGSSGSFGTTGTQSGTSGRTM